PRQVSASSTANPRPRRKSPTPNRTAGSSSTRSTRTAARGPLPALFTRPRRRLRGERPTDRPPGAAAGPGARDHAPPVVLDDALHDRQPEPGASPASGEERLEDAWQVLGAEPRTLVLHAAVDPRLAVFLHPLRLDADDALRRRVADGVVEQILE